MKNIVLAIIFIFSFSLANAQINPCNEITKEHDDELSKTTYQTPIVNNLTFRRRVADNGEYDYLALTFETTKKRANYDAVGLFVTFEDGTVWKDLNAHINCSYENTDIGYRYNATRSFDDRKEFASFKTKKIVKIRVDDIEIPINDALATKFLAWANCIETIK